MDKLIKKHIDLIRRYYFWSKSKQRAECVGPTELLKPVSKRPGILGQLDELLKAKHKRYVSYSKFAKDIGYDFGYEKRKRNIARLFRVSRSTDLTMFCTPKRY